MTQLVATVDSVTEILKSEGLVFEADTKNQLWTVTFDHAGGSKRTVILGLPIQEEPRRGASYLVIFAALVNPKLLGGLDAVDVSVLRKLLRLASGAWLARVDIMTFGEGNNRREHFLVRSECSVIGVDGGRLRRRMEAVAELAEKIDAEL